jgi:hypothetical protein
MNTSSDDPIAPALPVNVAAPQATAAGPELPPTADAPASTAEAAHALGRIVCANCGAELLGPTCYACGQPVKGMVRHLSNILADFADTVLNIDSRIFRTLSPLLLKPGFLTNEYLAGRRVRYVTPFRLYFFLSVIAFLIMKMTLDATLDSPNTIRFDDTNPVAGAMTVQQVEQQRDAALAGLETAKAAPGMTAKALRGIDKSEQRIRASADKRLDYLRRADEAKAKGQPAPADPLADSDKDDFHLELGGQDWDPHKTPVAIGWLPGFVNKQLTLFAVRGVENLPRIKKDPRPFLLGAFGMLPQVLFLLMPLFAGLLKIFYIFKRRLYMEHLIVALHSHSFIFLSLLVLTLFGLVRSWLYGAAPALAPVMSLAIFVLGWWLPIYLLIMQKRVYKQGWFFTTVKYLSIGFCYTIMVAFGVAIAFLVSLATT